MWCVCTLSTIIHILTTSVVDSLSPLSDLRIPHSEGVLVDFSKATGEEWESIFGQSRHTYNETQNSKMRRRLAESGWTDDEKVAILAYHNALRSTAANGELSNQPSATGMSEVFWDTALASVAQDWSDRCIFEHSGNSARKTMVMEYIDDAAWYFEETNDFTVGENAYGAYGGALDVDQFLDVVNVAWNEHDYYDFDAVECNEDTSVNRWGTCGHYKMLATDRVTYMGCGVTICDELQGTGWENALFVICEFSPSLYYETYTPYIEGEPASDCPTDRDTYSSDGLCSGCPNSYYQYCSNNWNCGYEYETPPTYCNNGITEHSYGYCCHASDNIDRFEKRCNLLGANADCLSNEYRRTCEWNADDFHCPYSDLPPNHDGCSCTADTGRRADYCQDFARAPCQFFGCDWECDESTKNNSLLL